MRAQQKLKTFQGISESAKLIKKIIGVFSAVFSPDYKHVVTWSGYSPFPGEPPINHDLELWDMAAGTKKTLKGHTDSIAAVVFSADSRYMVSASKDDTIRLWETATGRKVRTFGESAKKDADSGREWFSSATFSADGKYILSGGNEAKLWDVVTGKMERIYAGQAQGVLSVVLSPDGRKAVIGKNDGSIDICDLPTGNIIKVMQAHYYGVYALSVSSDGARLLSGSSDQTLKLWEFPTLKPLKTFSGFPHWVEAAAFSPDGRYAVSGDGEGYLRLFDLQSDQEIRAVRDHYVRLQDVAFSPDGKYVFSRGFTDDDRGGSHWIRLWNAGDLTLVREIGWGLISMDGRHALVKQSKEPFGTEPPRPFSILDVFNPKEEKTFTFGGFPLAVSPNQHYVLSKVSGNRVMFYDTITHRTHLSSSAHLSDVNAATFSSDDKFTLSASDDGTARLWETASGREMARMISFTDGEWIVITTEGYFNASANGAKHLSVRVGNQVYGIDQFYAKFYRPELVQLALAGKELLKGESLGDVVAKKNAPTVKIVSPVSGGTVDKDSVTVSLNIKDNGGGIGNVNIYLNGSQVANDTRGVIVKGKESTTEKSLSFTISLVDGVNEIKAVAMNLEGSMESNPAVITVISKAVLAKPNLYALVVGINEYKNKSISLSYAVPDALAFAETLRKTAEPLFGKTDIKILTTAEETTKDAVNRAFADLRSKVKPNDLFVFYDASHGVVDVVDNEEQYFLLTSNVLLLSSRHIGTDAISQKELGSLIGSIPAQKKLVILDTCNAGKGGKELQIALLQQTRGLTESTAVKLLQRSIGSAVFSASSDSQQALEGYKGHGLFTYVLLEGLQGKADIKKDGYITVLGLADYTEENVIKLSEEVFKRQQTPTIQTGANFPIGRVR
jgi:WD40 repeat protein